MILFLLLAASILADTTISGPICEFKVREKNPHAGWKKMIGAPPMCDSTGLCVGDAVARYVKEPDSLDRVWQAPCPK